MKSKLISIAKDQGWVEAHRWGDNVQMKLGEGQGCYVIIFSFIAECKNHVKVWARVTAGTHTGSIIDLSVVLKDEENMVKTMRAIGSLLEVDLLFGINQLGGKR